MYRVLKQSPTGNPAIRSLVNGPRFTGITIAMLTAMGLLDDQPSLKHPCESCSFDSSLIAKLIVHYCKDHINAITTTRSLIHQLDPATSKWQVLNLAPVDINTVAEIAAVTPYFLIVIPIPFEEIGVAAHARVLIFNVIVQPDLPIKNALKVTYTLYDPHGKLFCGTEPVSGIADRLHADIQNVIFQNFRLISLENRTNFSISTYGLQRHEPEIRGESRVSCVGFCEGKNMPAGFCSEFAGIVAILCIMLPDMCPADIERDILMFVMDRASASGRKTRLDLPGVLRSMIDAPDEVLPEMRELSAATVPSLQERRPGTDYAETEGAADNALYELVMRFSKVAMVFARDRPDPTIPVGTPCCCDANKRGVMYSVEGIPRENSKYCEKNYDKRQSDLTSRRVLRGVRRVTHPYGWSCSVM